MKHISLFSGIGGVDLACEWAGIETVCFVEIDPFCQKVLHKHWPNVPIVKDVSNVEEITRIVADSRLFRQTEYEKQTAGIEQCHEAVADSKCNRCDRTAIPILSRGSQQKDSMPSRNDSLLLTAGFPCQPFSQAGRRRGKDDSRYLWPQTLKVIESVKPDWVCLENVAGLLSMVFPDNATRVASQASLFGNENDEIADYDTIIGRIESDLRQAGYETVWFVVPACAIGAPHRRDRVFIVANSQNKGTLGREWFTPDDAKCGEQGRNQRRGSTRIDGSEHEDVANSKIIGLQGSIQANRGQRQKPYDQQFNGCHREQWAEPWYEVATRFCRVDDGIPDRIHRLKALGNAVVPQQIYPIIKAIADLAESRHSYAKATESRHSYAKATESR